MTQPTTSLKSTETANSGEITDMNDNNMSSIDNKLVDTNNAKHGRRAQGLAGSGKDVNKST